MKLSKRLKDSKAVIVLGSGGVGKTTSAMGLAMVAASGGKKVAVLSIDPSKRLAKALGFEPTSELQKLDIPFIDKAGGGEIFAAVVDQKSIFDQVVKKYGKSEKQVSQILSHPLYEAASSNLSGPIEYMSLAKFSDLMDDDSFDLVILDTPPDNNALDFLARPNLLAGFIDKNIMKWMIKPFALFGRLGMSKLLTMSEKLMGGLAKITGVSMLSQFAGFLVLMQEVIEGFHAVGSRVLNILTRADTTFFLVVSAAEDRMPGVEQFWGQLNQMGYKVSGVIANRCLPSKIEKELLDYRNEAQLSQLSQVSIYRDRMGLQKDIIKSLEEMTRNESGCSLYPVEDLIGEIENVEMFSQYLRELEVL